MNAVMCFWYCNVHDDGAVVFYPNDIFTDQHKTHPNWLNICCVPNNNCDYECKGVVELTTEGNIEVHIPVQVSYEREAGGYKFEYYVRNIYDNTTHDILENLPILLMDWFNEQMK